MRKNDRVLVIIGTSPFSYTYEHDLNAVHMIYIYICIICIYIYIHTHIRRQTLWILDAVAYKVNFKTLFQHTPYIQTFLLSYWFTDKTNVDNRTRCTHFRCSQMHVFPAGHVPSVSTRALHNTKMLNSCHISAPRLIADSIRVPYELQTDNCLMAAQLNAWVTTTVWLCVCV